MTWERILHDSSDLNIDCCIYTSGSKYSGHHLPQSIPFYKFSLFFCLFVCCSFRFLVVFACLFMEQNRSSGKQLLPNFSMNFIQKNLTRAFTTKKSSLSPFKPVRKKSPEYPMPISCNIFCLLLVSRDSFSFFWEIMWRFQFSITAASKRIQNGCAPHHKF